MNPVCHVGVFTPGFTTVQNSLVGYDRRLAALQAESADIADQESDAGAGASAADSGA